MSIRNLSSLLKPRSVALIGASGEAGSLGKVVIDKVIGGGFAGDLYLVNPHRVVNESSTWLADIQSLPRGVDLAVVTTPAVTVPDVVGQLSEHGVKVAIVLSAGVTRESGLHDAMMKAAKAGGMRVIGPNCLGAIMPHARLDASFSRISARPGKLALISQSGAMVTAILKWAESREIGFSAIISAGDMADVDLGDLIDLFATDRQTDAILLCIESIADAAKFMAAARAAAYRKPIIAIKAGRSDEAGKAALSHSGALAGSYQVYQAALDRAGVVVVENLGDLCDAAEVLSTSGSASGDNIAIVTNGGGAGVLAVDEIIANECSVATLSAATVAGLDPLLPATWSRANPVDLLGDAGPDRYAAATRAVLADPQVDAALVMFCPTAIVAPEDVARAVVEEVESARRAGAAKPLVACWLGGDDQEARSVLRDASIPVFDTPEDAARGFSFLRKSLRARKALVETAPSRQSDADHKLAKRIIAGARAEGRTLLNEIEAKDLLNAYNIPTIPTHFAHRAEDVSDACAGLAAPYAVKVISPDIIHKSDAGGVALSLSSPATAATAALAMRERIRREKPDATIAGFAVQSMSVRPHAVELLVGIADDPTFGPVILFGAGGTAVEVLDDVAMTLPPIDAAQADALIGRTRVARLLGGYRDHRPADRAALIDALVNLSRLVADFPDVLELDVNPLVCDADGVLALDARVVLSQTVAIASRNVIRPAASLWSADVTTRTGVALHIRPAVPQDEQLLSEFFGYVTPEDLRFRFLSSARHVAEEQIVAMTQVDYRRTISFLAIDSQGDVAAAVMLAADADRDRAEIAMSTRSDCKGKGVSYALLEHVLRYAEAEGIASVEAVEFADHGEALRIEREMGFSTMPCLGDPTLRIVRRAFAHQPAL